MFEIFREAPPSAHPARGPHKPPVRCSENFKYLWLELYLNEYPLANACFISNALPPKLTTATPVIQFPVERGDTNKTFVFKVANSSICDAENLNIQIALDNSVKWDFIDSRFPATIISNRQTILFSFQRQFVNRNLVIPEYLIGIGIRPGDLSTELNGNFIPFWISVSGKNVPLFVETFWVEFTTNIGDPHNIFSAGHITATTNGAGIAKFHRRGQ